MRVTLDGSKIHSREQLHAYLAEELHFPEWYGGNLDALYDCLTDLLEDVEFAVCNRDDLEANIGPYAKGFWRVLAQAEEENPHVQIAK